MRDVWVSVQHTSIVAGENLSATSCFCICTHTHNPGWKPDHLPHARSQPEGVRKIYSIREKNVSFVHKPLSESQDRLKDTGSNRRYAGSDIDLGLLLLWKIEHHQPNAPSLARTDGLQTAGAARRKFRGAPQSALIQPAMP